MNTNAHDVHGLLDVAARHKLLWAHAHVNTPEWERYMRLAAQAEVCVVGTPSTDVQQVAAKAELLLDWLSEDATPSAKALLGSIIADLEGLAKRQNVAPQPAAIAPPPPAPALAPVKEQNAMAAEHGLPRRTVAAPEKPRKAKASDNGNVVFKVRSLPSDPRCRPIVIDGILYPSLIVAAKETGIPYYRVQKLGEAA